MNDLLTVVLTCVAAASLTHIVARSRIAEPARLPLQLWFETRWIARETGGDEQAADQLWQSEQWLSRGAYVLGCTWCTGFWVGGAVTLGTDLAHGVPLPLLGWAAAMWTAGRYGE